jgi:RNA-directed DNA polymerase
MGLKENGQLWPTPICISVGDTTEYWRLARQYCYSLFSVGSYHLLNPFAVGEEDRRIDYSNLNKIEGILSYIHQVKQFLDHRDDREKKEHPTAFRKLYRNFLFFKLFIIPEIPVIVPEGKTDSIYLRCAIWRLEQYHPQLGGKNLDGKFRLNIRLMTYSKIVHEILDIGRGTGQLKALIENYDTTISKFGYCPLSAPVIVLVDNDDGGKKLFPLGKAKAKVEISYESSNDFYHLGSNLYLIKTQEQSAPPYTSRMEDFFDDTVLAKRLGEKSFDPDKDHEAPGKYGKAIFASQIVEPNSDSIDFSRFAPLLDRIVAVIEHHASLKEPAAPEAPQA